MRVAVYGPNLSAREVRGLKGTFAIHTEDCADRKRRPWAQLDRSGEAAWVIDAEDRVEVCDAVYTPGEFECHSGDYLHDFHFYPCCSELPQGEPKPAGHFGEPDYRKPAA